MKVSDGKKMIDLKIYKNFWNRFKGFMFKKNIDFCICFPHCNSIHTFFMFNKIDVIMTDKDYNILYIYKNLKPFKVILPKKNIYYTFELPTSTLNFKLNKKITIK